MLFGLDKFGQMVAKTGKVIWTEGPGYPTGQDAQSSLTAKCLQKVNWMLRNQMNGRYKIQYIWSTMRLYEQQREGG